MKIAIVKIRFIGLLLKIANFQSAIVYVFLVKFKYLNKKLLIKNIDFNMYYHITCIIKSIYILIFCSPRVIPIL